MNPPISILVVDDHAGFRGALLEILKTEPRIVVIAQAAEGGEAWALIQSLFPGIALVDIELPGLDGLQLLERIDGSGLDVSVIIVTFRNDDMTLNLALDAGAKGYVLKEDVALDLIPCILAVADGSVFVSRSMLTLLKPRQ